LMDYQATSAIAISVILFLITYFGLFQKLGDKIEKHNQDVNDKLAKNNEDIKEYVRKYSDELKDYIKKIDKEWDAKCASHGERVKAVEVENTRLWTTFGDKMADMLKLPIHLDRDILLEKYKKRVITFDEMITLNTILTEEYNVQKTLPLAMMISILETKIYILSEEKNKNGRLPI
jgi:hypothetical protein